MQELIRDPAARLEALRSALQALGFAGYLVPKGDAFQNESVPDYADRLAWLTGFSGSAGQAVVLQDKAALIVDSRYTLQAKGQISSALYSVLLFPETTVAGYLGAHAPKAGVIGYDPNLYTLAVFKTLRAEAEKAGFGLAPSATNPIDGLWTDRPAEEHAAIFMQDERYAGESAAAKIARVQNAISEKGADGLFIAAPDSVAWLLNIRGWDIQHTPLPLVRAYLPASGKPALLVSPGHITAENRAALEAVATLHDLVALDDVIGDLLGEGRKVLIDPVHTTLAIDAALKTNDVTLIEETDPVALFKARKNAAELAGARNAHLRDGAALSRFLAWIDVEAPEGTLDEIAASDKLEAFRRATNRLECLSFDTISGAGSNGAIVHYRATRETNKRLLPGTLYLIDSGGQYRDGTTDVTRTIAIGTPTPEMRRHFTLVLKGHIAIATARFPVGTRGVDIDAFARRSLWEAGFDYGHGTGHGIGSFLSVHEGPQSISRNGMIALEPGMIVSNEPGYYREGHYGIRLENLLAVTEAQSIEGGEIPMLAFETLTLAPFDRRLIDPELLSPAESAWIDAYHERVFKELSPLLSAEDASWLAAATAPL